MVWIALGIVAVVAILGALAGGDDDNDDEPSGGTELCDLLSDPANRRLTTGDLRRLTDFRLDELEDYVASRCPEHLRRVSD